MKNGLTFPVSARDANSPDARLIAACEAARDAMGAFDDSAKRNAPFYRLCELLEQERSAVKAVATIRSGTPRGIAEKALLAECIVSAGGRAGRKQETYDIALSLAADAIALAKATSNGGSPTA